MKTLEEITAELDALGTRATEALATAEADSTKVEEVKSLVETELSPKIALLTKERDDALNRQAQEDIKSQLTDLHSVVQELQKPGARFTLPGDEHREASGEGKALYADGKHSVYADMRLANKGNSEALARLTEGIDGLNAEGKAMTEGTAAQGGYLVRPQVERQIVEALELDNKIRSLCSSLNVTTNGIQLDQLGLSTTAGWVAELAQKPESTGMSLATITASVFTAAGLATISNQLLADSDPAVDSLVTSDLAKRLVALEETAFLNGSGSGQPLGILNTPGLGATSVTTNTIAAVIDAILTAIGSVEDAHGAPSAIVMHPRTWTQILKSKDAAGAWNIAPGLVGVGSGATVQGSRTVFRGPEKSLWGYPVITSNRIPTTLGGGTESRVIVGDFREALILDRQGITVDESPHVLFTSNQTIFRAEKRVGFTAARTPTAFSVVGGVGLAGL